MKQILCFVTALVVMVSAFCMPAGALTLDMGSVVSDDRLPVGFLVSRFYHGFGIAPNTLIFYESSQDIYFSISYSGFAALYPNSGLFNLSFTDPDSLVIRAYECSGRAIFDVTDGYSIRVTYPAQSINYVLDAALDTDTTFKGRMLGNVVGGQEFPRNWPDRWTVNYSGDKAVSITPSSTQSSWLNSVYHEDLELNSHSFSSDTLGKLTGTIKAMQNSYSVSSIIPEHKSQFFDYYRVPMKNDPVSSSIDYKYLWSFDSSGYLSVLTRLYGYPISFRGQSGGLRYIGGAYYDSSGGYLFNAESLPASDSYRPRLSVLNRLLTHFGYQPLSFSEVGYETSQDMSDISRGMGGYFDKMNSFTGTANSSISNISNSMTKVSTVASKIWGVMPPWFWACLSLAMVFLVARKGIGR